MQQKGTLCKHVQKWSTPCKQSRRAQLPRIEVGPDLQHQCVWKALGAHLQHNFKRSAPGAYQSEIHWTSWRTPSKKLEIPSPKYWCHNRDQLMAQTWELLVKRSSVWSTRTELWTMKCSWSKDWKKPILSLYLLKKFKLVPEDSVTECPTMFNTVHGAELDNLLNKYSELFDGKC